MPDRMMTGRALQDWSFLAMRSVLRDWVAIVNENDQVP